MKRINKKRTWHLPVTKDSHYTVKIRIHYCILRIMVWNFIMCNIWGSCCGPLTIWFCRKKCSSIKNLSNLSCMAPRPKGREQKEVKITSVWTDKQLSLKNALKGGVVSKKRGAQEYCIRTIQSSTVEKRWCDHHFMKLQVREDSEASPPMSKYNKDQLCNGEYHQHPEKYNTDQLCNGEDHWHVS